MFKLPTYKASPVVLEALDKLFILHADHEQNCSTSTVRMVGSSHAGLFAISAEYPLFGALFTVEQIRQFLKC
jgi:citrate synthase